MSIYQKLNKARLHELLSYDKETGIFMWKKRRLGVRVGIPLGCDNGKGYLRITVDGTSQYAHRLAWVYEFGDLSGLEIDHINGVKSDNRIANLRLATAIENQQNKREAMSNNKAGMLGASWHKDANKWQAHICKEGKRTYLGLHETADKAHQAYVAAKREIHPFSTI